jgi:hypothetical protein
MEKEKDSKLKQAMKGLDSFLTTHYSFRYNHPATIVKFKLG